MPRSKYFSGGSYKRPTEHMGIGEGPYSGGDFNSLCKEYEEKQTDLKSQSTVEYECCICGKHIPKNFSHKHLQKYIFKKHVSVGS